MSTQTVERTTTITEDGDHDRFSHYFRKSDLDSAFLDGETITAICGASTVPTRDPKKFTVCPTCKAVWLALKVGD